jgi:oligoribonuclease
MHTRSNLLEAIAASTVTLEEAGRQTLEFLRQHIPEARTVPLCGNSIGTDRRFLAVHLPEIEEYLHYRSVDVTSVKELIKRWNPRLLDAAPGKAQGHRAMDDIRESLEELRFYRDHAFVTPAAAGDGAGDESGGEAATQAATAGPAQG